MKNNILLGLICVIFISGLSLAIVNAQEKTLVKIKEPIMEYKYTVEEEKIKRAQFIWKSSMEELRQDGIFKDEDIKNINVYLGSKMKSDRFEAPMKKYDKQKKALRPFNVDEMVINKVITKEQGDKLKDKFSKYNFSNLDK